MNTNPKIEWPGWKTNRLIGRGSFGAVYEIERDVFGDVEKAALKVISIPQNASDVEDMLGDGFSEEDITSTFQSHLQSIVAEYSLMKKMNGCANIVNCDDVRYVQHDDGYGWDIFIKMELLTPLMKALPNDIPEDAATKLAKDMCAALQICKQHDVIHRDIKPQNIFVSPYGDYKLGDFGIAKTVERTMGGTKIGTYRYMAPEVYNNQPYNSTADIYSLGLVLYWMLNEKRMPFLPLPPAKITTEMESEMRLWRFQGKQLPPPAHGSEKLKRIVLKACAFDPKDRYQTAAEMLVDLNDEVPVPIPIPVPVPPKPEPPKPEPPKPEPPKPEPPKHEPEPGKKKGLFLGAVAAVVALIIIILLLMRSCEPKEPFGTEPVGTGNPTETTEVVYEPELNTDRLALFQADTAMLTVSGVPEDAKIKWKSDDKTVAKVSDEGEVTAVGEGVAVITATWKYDGETYEMTAEVTVTASGVTLSEYTINDFYIGETRTLTATTSPEGEKVEWRSSDEKVITVSEEGVVTAVGSGSASITVSFGTYSETCNITVTEPSLTLSKTTSNLYAGDSTVVTVKTDPEGATVTWSSDNSGVATVSDGTIQAVNAGITAVRAKITHAGKTYEQVCNVTVISPSVSMSNGSISILPGQSKNLSASSKPEGLSVSWSSSNTGVATVSGGKVTAVAPGSATITAQVSYKDKTYKSTCSVTVITPSVSLSNGSLGMYIGESKSLSASTNTGSSVSWSSSNTSVATVSGGTVTAVAPGSATITAQITYAGQNYKASCNVTVYEPTISVTSSASTITYAEREQDRETCTVTATVNPGGGNVKWSSSNPDVAEVSGNGTTATVKAVKSGSTTITATYTAYGKTVSSSCTINVAKAKSKLTFVVNGYPSRGSLANFYLNGYFSSNYELDRLECWGNARSNATGDSMDATCDTYYFGNGIYETDFTGNMVDHIRNQYSSLYNGYVFIAGLLGEDKSVTMTVTLQVYDKSGASQAVTITYVLDEG